MPDALTTVFVSATSRDLKSYREIAKNALLTGGVHPVVQEHFPPDYRELLAFLRMQVSRCDAVLCLVGFVYGAAPQNSQDLPRSYTQLEYDVARELGKPVYVFLASEDCPLDQPPADGAAELELQRRHRAALLGAHRCTLFSTPEGLRLVVAEMVPWLPRPEGKPAPAPFSYLQRPKEPAFFAGRLRELRQFHEALARASPCLVAVVGLGGQGKSTLVHQGLKKCEQQQGLLPGLWCCAGLAGYTFDNFLDDALTYLQRGQFDKREFPERAARVRRLLALLQVQPTLWVIDNFEHWLRGWSESAPERTEADTVDQRQACEEGLDDFLAQTTSLGNGCHIVLTTRALPAVLDDAVCALIPVYDEGSRYDLEGLEDEAAIELLRQLGVRGETAEILQTARSYANHPLALTVLGGLLSKHFGGRLERLERVDAFDPKRRLFQLFEESRRRLPGGARAERFLQAASLCVENPDLPTLAAALGPDAPTQGELLDQAVTLAAWHQLEWDAHNEVVHLHPLMRQYYAERAADSAVLHGRLSDWYAQKPIAATAAGLDQVRGRLLAIEHALRAGNFSRCAELAFSALTPSAHFAEWIGEFGHLTTGADLFGRLATASTGHLPADFLIARAGWLRQLGQLDAARADLDRALELLGTLADAETPPRLGARAGALMTRGNVSRQAGRFADAVADYDRAVEVFDRLSEQFPQARIHLAQARMNRGNVNRDTGHLNKALADLNSAIALYQTLTLEGWAVDLPLAAALANRGNVHADGHHFATALADFDHAVDLYRQRLAGGQAGRCDLDVPLLNVQIMRGATLTRAGNHEEALHELDRAIDALKRHVNTGRGDLEPQLALAYRNRSAALLGLGRLDQAVEQGNLAVAIYERLQAAGRKDLRTWLAQALIVRAQARHTSDGPGSAVDRARSLELLRQLIQEGEWDVPIVVLHLTAPIIRALLPHEPSEALALCREALTLAAQGLAGPGASEELAAEVRRVLADLDDLFPALLAIGLDRNLLIRLRSVEN